MWRAALVASLAFAIVACGIAVVPAANPSGSPAAAANAQYLGAITAPIDYDGAHHIHLRPPVGSPAVQWTSALGSCNPFCGIAETQPPVVELVSFSDDQYQIASSARPVYQNVLAYMVLWRGVRCFDVGPRGRPTPNPNIRCDAFYFVDAMTGQRLSAYEVAVT